MTPKTVKEWFESEPNQKMRKLLLERMERPYLKCNNKESAINGGFGWGDTPEGVIVWRHYCDTGIFAFKPWIIASYETTYTRILASIKGKLHYFPLECDGKDIDMYMPLNDAVDWMREEYRLFVWASQVSHKFRGGVNDGIIVEDFPDYPTAIAAGLNKACDIVNDKNEQPCN